MARTARTRRSPSTVRAKRPRTSAAPLPVTMMELRRSPGEYVSRCQLAGESFALQRAGRTVALLMPVAEVERLRAAAGAGKTKGAARPGAAPR